MSETGMTRSMRAMTCWGWSVEVLMDGGSDGGKGRSS